MQHLDSERLASLDHDGPSAGEQAHLDNCEKCRSERAAFERLQKEIAFGADKLELGGERLTEWANISAVLKQENLIKKPPHLYLAESRPEPKFNISQWPIRIAAALAFMVVGAAFGRIDLNKFGISNTSELTVAKSDTEFTSVEQASRVLNKAQIDFERASSWLATNDTTSNAQDVYRARLAALDQMILASSAGLNGFTEDPLLNKYYLAAYNAREATLAQLDASLSVDKVMERF